MKRIAATLLISVLPLLLYTENTIKISKIIIRGNEITKEEIILREVIFITGQSFTISDLNKKIEESRENLVNLKLFNFVEINYTLKQEEAEITIDLTERWYFWPYPILEISDRNFNTWWQEFKATNYSDLSRLNYGIFLNWENFRGRNELIKLKIRKGFKEHYLLSYQVPYFNKAKTIGLNTDLQFFRRKKTFYATERNTLRFYTNDDKFTTTDYEFNTEILYRKGVHKTHSVKAYYFISLVDPEITSRNPYYLYNNANTGSYGKLSYHFKNEKRDYSEYPLSGYFLNIEATKFFKSRSPVNHFEIIGTIEKHIELKPRTFLGSSLKAKWASNAYRPYFMQKGFGFEDYVRGYEYYVIDGQKFWLAKTILKYALIEQTDFKVPYLKMKQFNKAHYSLYLSIFSDMGYVVDNQTYENNNLSNSFLLGNGISIDYVTYYDKMIRIEFSINHLGEKGVFLHFSNPFGSKDEL